MDLPQVSVGNNGCEAGALQHLRDRFCPRAVREVDAGQNASAASVGAALGFVGGVALFPGAVQYMVPVNAFIMAMIAALFIHFASTLRGRYRCLNISPRSRHLPRLSSGPWAA